MTHNEAHQLMTRASRDHAFRQRLLARPEATAAELAIELSADDVGRFKRQTRAAQRRCLNFDKLRDNDRRALILFKVAGAAHLNLYQ